MGTRYCSRSIFTDGVCLKDRGPGQEGQGEVEGAGLKHQTDLSQSEMSQLEREK